MAKSTPTAEASFRKLVASPRFVYNVKFICGIQKRPFDNDCTAILSKGIYSTEINILNFGFKPAIIAKAFIPLVIKNESIAIEPKFSRLVNAERVELPPISATMDDCCKLAEMIKVKDEQLKIGYVEIISSVELEVVAVYTVTNLEQDQPSISVVPIVGKKLALG